MLIPVLFLMFGGPPVPVRQVLPGGESVVTPIKLELAREDPTTGTKIFAASDGKSVYVAGRSQVSSKNPVPAEIVLANAAAGGASGIKGKIVSTLPLSISGWPGLECRMKSKEGFDARFRTIVVKDTMYQVGYISMGASAMTTEADAYLSSFALPAAIPRGPLSDDKLGWRRVFVEKSDLSAEFSAAPKLGEVELPNAPADSPVRMQRIVLMTSVETLILATVPIPAVVADQLDATKELRVLIRSLKKCLLRST